MGVIAWVILGAVAGWIASIIMRTDNEQGGMVNIIVGIIGAVIGGLIMQALGESGVSGFNLYSLLVATGGAVVLLLVYQAFAGRT